MYVIGYPFGEQLGKNVTVSTSSVSSLRYDNDHILKSVQVNGGMNPGNSGGPVVDANGDVLATVFAKAIGEGPGSGLGVPDTIVKRAVTKAKGPVDTGPCVA